jgi:DNA-binding NtrC family response regulator
MFGHEKGAFTGAAERHTGKFVDASGGTLFLDEIGELPLAAQVKLLRVLQEGEVDPVGAKKPLKVDVRIISATNRDLIADVRTGRFREDLYYRLSVFPIGVPPLRERTEDIPHLVRHFLLRFAAEEGKRVRTVSAEALALLMGFSWPGNVRQLENAIFRSVVLAEGDTIGSEEFPQIAVLGASETTLVPDQGLHTPSLAGAAPMQPLVLQPAEGAAAAAGPDLNLPLNAMLPLLDAAGDVLALDAIEAAAIRFAIAHYRGQMSEVARKLRIGRSTLYRKLEHLGMAEGPGEADVSGR